MRKTFKYRCYPTKSEIKKIDNLLNLTRLVYNNTLALRKDNWETEQVHVSLYDSSNYLTQWKIENPDLRNVYSQVLQNAQLRVDLAFKAFFRRCKSGENPGYPRFKSFGRYHSMTYPSSGFKIHPDNTTYLSKIGRIKTVFHRELIGTIKTCTINKTSTNKYFITFSCEVVKPDDLPKTNKITGIDLGTRTYIQCSDGFKIDKPNFFNRSAKLLAKRQRKLARYKIDDPRRKHQRLSVARVHEHVKNQREDFCHKAANTLISKYDLIVHEDLNIKKMIKNSNVALSNHDAAWHQLIQFISYKAENAGRKVVSVNPAYTSQQCSQCGTMVWKDGKVRTHHCKQCGLKIDRDLNASINILRLGLQSDTLVTM